VQRGRGRAAGEHGGDGQDEHGDSRGGCLEHQEEEGEDEEENEEGDASRASPDGGGRTDGSG